MPFVGGSAYLPTGEFVMTRITRRLLHTALLTLVLSAGMPAAAEPSAPAKRVDATAPGAWELLFDWVRPLYEWWTAATTTTSSDPAAADPSQVRVRSTTEYAPTMDPNG